MEMLPTVQSMKARYMTLAMELAKEKPSRKTVRILMKETLAGRRHWVLIDSSPVTEVIISSRESK